MTHILNPVPCKVFVSAALLFGSQQACHGQIANAVLTTSASASVSSYNPQFNNFGPAAASIQSPGTSQNVTGTPSPFGSARASASDNSSFATANGGQNWTGTLLLNTAASESAPGKGFGSASISDSFSFHTLAPVQLTLDVTNKTNFASVFYFTFFTLQDVTDPAFPVTIAQVAADTPPFQLITYHGVLVLDPQKTFLLTSKAFDSNSGSNALGDTSASTLVTGAFTIVPDPKGSVPSLVGFILLRRNRKA
jgi:hypothetical protein